MGKDVAHLRADTTAERHVLARAAPAVGDGAGRRHPDQPCQRAGVGQPVTGRDIDRPAAPGFGEGYRLSHEAGARKLVQDAREPFWRDRPLIHGRQHPSE